MMATSKRQNTGQEPYSANDSEGPGTFHGPCRMRLGTIPQRLVPLQPLT